MHDVLVFDAGYDGAHDIPVIRGGVPSGSCGGGGGNLWTARLIFALKVAKFYLFEIHTSYVGMKGKRCSRAWTIFNSRNPFTYYDWE